jgi:putative flippase GtrA
MKPASLSVVIPVYNEEATIRSILAKVRSAPLPAEITKLQLILVDDCSTDGTPAILKEYEESCTLVAHPTNQGKGAALQTGFRAAWGDLVLIQDADLEYDPAQYCTLLEPLLSGQAQVVYGSRFASGQTRTVGGYWHWFANAGLTAFSNLLSGLHLTDMETCYKVFTRPVLNQLSLTEKRFGIEPEITAKLAHLVRTQDLSIHEVPVRYAPRTWAQGKKIGAKDGLRALFCILKYNTTGLAVFLRYCLMGLLVALSQYLSMVGLVELAGFTGILGQNTANILSLELSLLVAFALHRSFTWSHAPGPTSISGIARQLLGFHGVSLASVGLRIALFFGLSLLAFPYGLNLLLGIGLALVLNFIGYHHLVFRKVPLP